PRLFSFNSPYGACERCDGLGTKLEVDLDSVIPHWDKTLNEHAIAAWEPISSQYYPQLLKSICQHYDIDMHITVNDIPEKQLNKILYGSGTETITFRYVNDFGKAKTSDIQFEGVLHNIARRYHHTSSDFVRETLEKYMAESACPACDGYRLNEQALSVKIDKKHISEVTDFSINDALTFFENVSMTDKEQQIAHLILKEIDDRLSFLKNVG